MARNKLTKEEKEKQVNEVLNALQDIYLHGTKDEKKTLSELLKRYQHNKQMDEKRKEIRRKEEEVKREKENFKKTFGVEY